MNEFTENKPTGKIVIAGGSGFLGKNLARHLAALGCEVAIISRTPPKEDGPWTHYVWDCKTIGTWAEQLERSSAVVNLTGRTVDCIKTPKNCDEILNSRVNSVRVLSEAMKNICKPPPVWIQMSTAHIYGDPPVKLCDEDSNFGQGLAPRVGQAWEKAYNESVPPHTRQVILRTSFVIGRGGGAFPKLKALARYGFGGKAGSGKQGISWIHEHDMNRLFAHAIANESVKGTYVATAPEPVSYKTFMKTLRKQLRMPIGLPSPAWLIRFGARFFLHTDPELVLLGRYCTSKRLKEENFEFKFPEIQRAIEDLCKLDKERIQ